MHQNSKTEPRQNLKQTQYTKVQSVSSTKNAKPDEVVATDVALRCFLGYRLKQAYNVFRSDLLLRLEPLGLRITTFSALLLVVENPGLRQSALAKVLDIKSSNIVAIIDDLEVRGWVSRMPVAEDRRALALFATSSGKRTCKKAVSMASEQNTDLVGCLSDEERMSFVTLLEKIESSRGIV